jgi:hypothetical protein
MFDTDADEQIYSEGEVEQTSHEYREAAIKSLVFMQGAIQFLRDSKTPSELAMRLDLVSYTFCLPAVAGLSMEELGKPHNRGRQSISNQLLTFQRQYNIPAAISQKCAEARPVYHKARLNKITA